MRRLLPLLTLALACGGPPAPPPPDDPPDRVRRVDEPPPAEEPVDDDAAPATEVEVDPIGLSGLSGAALVAAIEAIPPRRLEAVRGALEEGGEAWRWATLRAGLLAAHGRRVGAARALLELVASGPEPTAGRAKAALRRVIARAKVDAGRVGVLLPLSGPYAPIGQTALKAIKLALEDHPGVKLTVSDTSGDADRARQVVDALVHQKHVAAIIGPVGSIESRAAAEVAERLEVPIMTLSAEEGLTRLGTFVFRHRVTKSDQARGIARYAVEQMGLKHFAILYPDAAYGREMMRAFWETVERLGGEIRGAEGYPVNEPEVHDAIKKLVGRYHLEVRTPDSHWERLNRKARDKAHHVPPIVDFEALFVPDTGRRLGQVLPYLPYWDIELRTAPDLSPMMFAPKYAGRTPQLVQLLGASGFNDPRFVRRVGEVGHNAVFVDAFWADSTEARPFVDRWTAAHGAPPPGLAAHAFDAAQMIARALEAGADRDAVRRALLNLADHRGVFGPVKIDGRGDVRIPLKVLTIRPETGIAPRTEEMGAEPAYEDEPYDEEDRPL